MAQYRYAGIWDVRRAGWDSDAPPHHQRIIPSAQRHKLQALAVPPLGGVLPHLQLSASTGNSVKRCP
jgi:hypothetical protein